MSRYKAKLIRIIDGDTIDAEIEAGFDIYVRKRIRLWGINAPERRSKDKDEVKASKRATKRLTEILSLSKGVFELVVHGDGKYGRCLGEIFVNNLSESINNTLIKEGLVKKYE